MKTVKLQKLTLEAFRKFGAFSGMIDPIGETAGSPDAETVFYRDMLQQELGGGAASYSTCRVRPRPSVITTAEYHNHACEVALPLNGDAILWFAPASAGNDFPTDKVEAFLVPRGTVVSVRPGVWHHAAYAVGSEALDVLIVLPERTYANDTFCVELDADRQIRLDTGDAR